jgi:DNA-binding response OmpR family regulator
MRRNRQEEVSGTELRIADLRLDLVRHKAYRGSVEICLQPLEFKLLQYMVHNKGQVLSKTEIMEQIWDLNIEPDTNVVEVRMHHLRNKVDKPFKLPLIHTERGVGYVLEERSVLSEEAG